LNLSPLFFSSSSSCPQGAFLALLRREARRVSDDPVNHPIAQRMRDDPFYRTYLVPRMQARPSDRYVLDKNIHIYTYIGSIYI
jgi:hypothetical protein